MVFSDDFLHFLKIKNFFSWIHQNYLVALIYLHLTCVMGKILLWGELTEHIYKIVTSFFIGFLIKHYNIANKEEAC